MLKTEEIVAQTKKWITDVVIACNFCPFANKVVKENTVHYEVASFLDKKDILQTVNVALKRLSEDKTIETSFLIFPNGLEDFSTYLDVLNEAEIMLRKNGYKGIYQLASFHPAYMFAGSSENDAANYTNRSIYPMIHLLREASITKALKYYGSTDNIPSNNIAFAKEKGLAYMKMLRDSCVGT